MKKSWYKYAIAYACALVLIGIVYYVMLPPLNLQSTAFWTFLTVVLVALLVPACLRFQGTAKQTQNNKNTFGVNIQAVTSVLQFFKPRPFLAVAIIPIVVVFAGNLISSTFFFARSYANVIEVKEAVFEDDMPETDMVTNIALMDSETAATIGKRTLGNLSDVVSQYEVSPNYTQINYRRTPQKVATLEYADFFKWFSNRQKGIPGYVMVDPVSNTAEYCSLSKPIVYTESGFFGDDLMRKLRFSYPTKIFGDVKYEIDDEGNPVYIVPCMKPKVALFGALDVAEVIIFDPVTGTSELRSLADTPTWIDNVYDGYLATEKYNWKGMYSGGFFNSVVGNRDCKVTTDDFGYIILEDDVWYFTGVTSVNSDESNIGFIISNARTGEYKFYPVIGAEEHSAMSAAEGEVQEKGYVASFPALINVEGEATYIMVLKDSGGLVKLYALVNVEKYSLVATGTDQQKAMEAYKKLLAEEGILDSDEQSPPADDTFTATLTVDDVFLITLSSDTYAYLSVKNGEEELLLKIKVADNEKILFIRKDDSVSFTYTKTDEENIYEIISFEKQ